MKVNDRTGVIVVVAAVVLDIYVIMIKSPKKIESSKKMFHRRCWPNVFKKNSQTLLAKCLKRILRRCLPNV